MGEFIILILAMLSWCFLLAAINYTKPKSSFIIKGYKNGELIYQQTIVNDTFEVGPGDKYDKIEIIG